MNQNEAMGPLNKTTMEHNALKYIGTFSLLSIIAFALSAGIAVVSLSYLTRFLTSILQTSAVSTSLLGFEIAIIVGGIVTGILQLLSFVFLRKGYKTLKGISTAFSSPYSGVNLFFLGLVLVIIGVIVFIPLLLLHATVAGVAIGIIAIVLIGAVLCLVGEILALIVGSFRLKAHFNNSSYGISGIMFIVGIFVPFISLVGAILIYVTTNSELKKDPITP